MSVITAAQAKESLQDYLGDKVKFHKDWPQADTAGSFDGHGFLNHWTAMSKRVSVSRQIEVLRYGYPGLPGPLCHGAPTWNGILWMIGWGNCNHAGMGDGNVYRLILDGDFHGQVNANDESVDGNQSLYGWEHMFHPDDGKFTDEMFEAGCLGSAALADAHGWDAKAAAGSMADHYEWASRKWDREVQNLANRSRSRTEAILLGEVDTKTQLEEIMSSDNSKREFARMVAEEVADLDAVPWPRNIVTAAQKKKNPNAKIYYSLFWIMQELKNISTRQGGDQGAVILKELRELNSNLVTVESGLEELQSLTEKIDDSMTDTERHQLANDIASKVDSLRIDVKLSRVDENEVPE